MTQINTVFCQRYLEADEFFGTKPDGFSVHTSMEALKVYSKPYAQYNRGDGETYTDGQPYTVQASQLPAGLLEKLEASKDGTVRVYKGQFAIPTPPKESGGLWESISENSYGMR